MKTSRLIPLLLLITLFTSRGQAQVAPGDSPELNTLRLRYKSELQTARLPIRTRYVAALSSLLQAKTATRNTEAAAAIQNAIAAANGKPALLPAGTPSADLTGLMDRAAVELQTAVEVIQARYVAALEPLETYFTQRNNPSAATGVRSEINAIKAPPAACMPSVSNENPMGTATLMPRWNLAKLPAKQTKAGYGEVTMNGDVVSAHASSRIVYTLPRGVTKFVATGKAMDEEGEKNGTWRYIIKVDGKEVFRSDALIDTKNLKVPIEAKIPLNALEMELIIDSMGSIRNDHSGWAAPVLE